MPFRGIVLLLTVWLVAALPAAAETQIVFQAPGASKDLRSELRANSLVVTEGRKAEPQDLFAAAQADYARLLGVLYENAYYGGVIYIRVDGREAASIPPLSIPTRIDRVEVLVRPGPVYRFSDARIGPLAPGTELPDDFRRGAPAGTGTIRAAAEAGTEGWRAAGYAKAEIAQQAITARHDRRTVGAQLTIAPGPKLSFGPVRVHGNRLVRTDRVVAIAGLPEGRTYDPEEVARAERRLRRTGAFSSVTVEESPDIGPDSTLPLTIDVVEAKKRRFGLGVEYSTVEGVRLSGFWLHRNLLGGAERLRFDAAVAGLGGETGGADTTLGLRFERPATPAADIDFFTELQFESLDEPDFQSETVEFTLGFTRYVTDTLTLEAGLGYIYSDAEDAFGRETYELLTLPLAGERDRRNDQLDATEGYYIDLEVTPFIGLAGTSNGAEIVLDSRAYRTFDGLTFAGRLQLGSLLGPSLAESPPIYRFYSGGGGTVRGQDYQSLGVDVGGQTTGGRSFLGLSGEIRRDVTENIQVVGFADWGYIGAESIPDFTGESHAGAGLGLRYKTGIGPIRVDIATPVAGDTSDGNFFLYIGIGQAF